MKNKFLFGAVCVTAFLLPSCGGGNSSTSESIEESKSSYVEEKSSTQTEILPGYVRYDLKTPHARKTEGVGAQFDTCILDPYNNQFTDWEVISNAARTANLQAIRVRFYPEMYERGNDNDNPDSFDYESPNVDFNSAEMQHLYQLLDLMEELHVNVDLSWYGCRSTFASEDGCYQGSWLGGKYGQDGIDGWMVAPNSKYAANPDSEFAESVSACLNYLINVKKYTCLYEYSIFPEPEGVISDMSLYGNIAKKIKEKLKGYGLEGKIKFSGPADYGNNAKNLKEKFLSKDYGYDKVDSSVYCFRGEVDTSGNPTAYSLNEAMYNFAKDHVDVCEEYGTSWGLAECGTANFLTAVTNSDTELFDRAMTMMRYFINFSNAGATNFKYFIFSDCSYDGINNEEGLFRFIKSYYKDSEIDYQAKPIWYSWSLIMRYTDIGSTIYPVTNDFESGIDPDICITAIKLPDGSWSYFMTNMSNEAKKVAIVNENEGAPTTMAQFKLTAGTTPSGAEATLKIIEKQKDITITGNAAHVSIPAKGIIVLSNKK